MTPFEYAVMRLNDAVDRHMAGLDAPAARVLAESWAVIVTALAAVERLKPPQDTATTYDPRFSPGGEFHERPKGNT